MTPFSEQLAAGIAQMQLDIPPAQQQKLLDYLALLQKWNKTYNLTALRDPAQMISHHLLDSLTILPYLANAQSMIDVGSGGGMPAIPAAICRPDLRITMVDANSKKTTFLRQAIIELGLDNAAVSSSRVEDWQDNPADIVTSRAFAELADFVRLTRHLLGENGHWAAMKGVYPQDELFRLPENVAAYQIDHRPRSHTQRRTPHRPAAPHTRKPTMSAKIIAIANQKGGVGKTTTAVNLAASLAHKKQCVLLIDLDPQGNATTGSGIDKTSIEQGVYHVLLGEADIQAAKSHSQVGGYDLLAANRELAGAEVELVQEIAREMRLKNALALVADDYDYILIDCPPTLTLLTLNGLVAADGVLVPMVCEYYALEGISDLVATVRKIRNAINPQLGIFGIVRTLV